jgi:hypothetical protein
MSRSKKRGRPKCPEGHKCNICGGKASADHRDAKRTEGRRKRAKEPVNRVKAPGEVPPELDAASGILLFVHDALGRLDAADVEALKFIEQQCDQLRGLRDIAEEKR